MSHGAKKDPSGQIDKIRLMIREFIRVEVVPYELTNQEKISFILKFVRSFIYKFSCSTLFIFAK